MISAATVLTLTMLLASGLVPAADADQAAEGAALVGARAPGWETAEWLNGESLRLEDLRGKVVLVRWWTDTCPYCTRSAPALVEFHERYAERGLTVVGIYHPRLPVSGDGTNCLHRIFRETGKSRGGAHWDPFLKRGRRFFGHQN